MRVDRIFTRLAMATRRSATLAEAAAAMSRFNVGMLLVMDDGKVEPVGIVTDRDLRNKVVAAGLDPRELRVSDVMNSPLVTIGENEYLFKALFLMSRRRIHRLCVVDADGRLSGILTDSDVLRLQSRSPQQLMLEIEEADSAEALKALHRKVEELVVHLVGTGIDTRDLVQTVAHLNDRILARLIELVRAERYPDLTKRFAFVVLGIMLLFAVIVARAFAIARAADEAGMSYSARLAQGLGLLLALQAMINMGVNIGLLPPKGMTLPFISAGGSSMLALAITAGMLLALTRWRPDPMRLKKPRRVATIDDARFTSHTPSI